MDVDEIKNLFAALTAEERKTADKCHHWAMDDAEQARINDLCVKVETIVSEFMPDNDTDDFLLMGLSLVQAYTEEMDREIQKDVLHALAGSMKFYLHIGDLEKENG